MNSYKHTRQKKDSFLFDASHTKTTTSVFFVVSLLLHVLVFCGVIFFPNIKSNKPAPKVIQIDLVTFASAPAVEKEPDTAPPEVKTANADVSITKEPKQPVKKKIKHKKPDISLKTKPKNLKKLIAQKKEKKPEKKPLEKKEPEPKEPPPEPDPPEKTKEPPKEAVAEKKEKTKEDLEKERIAEALERMKSRVAQQGDKRSGAKTADRSGTGKGQPIDIYHLVMKAAITQNWTFNETLANKDLEVRILLKILKSGEIRDIIFDTRSGNRFLDASAKNAILKSNPLPPLPEGMKDYDVGLIFTPKGLK